ncbi:MalY/PatB family protein [Paenibacillus glucanolyticus]|uniref:MalY/PatB family protein n=1 Tax=Paenibacillus glucanolyticus TaxID=59843 RepID=UPI00096F2E10|nr:PatB family C-S lyase [Paenibacillus glucanolyticus]OMF68353.1 cystathionine beta-lyase [Paenibacillus glucanolyticus]
MNFDLAIDRTCTNCQKWDNVPTVFGVPDALPMWVADMDFAAPPAVVEALHKRVEHGVFGYTFPPDSYREAISDWMKKRHSWNIQQEWIQFCPGVVPALSLIVDAFTEPGDQVVIQTPVYPPFYSVVQEHGRELVHNPLLLSEEGDYTMDFEDLEKSFSTGHVKMIILCSPHNPVGRVWSRAELDRLASLCQQYDVLVVSDEIHADLVFEPGAHTPFAALSEDAAERSIICTAPSKTFNIAGLNTANIIIPNAQLRSKFRKILNRYAIGSITPMGAAATEAAYREGEPWLDELLVYIRGNMELVVHYVREHLPELKVVMPEATYLLWIDFRGMGIPHEELNRFLVQQAKLGLNSGAAFGKEGDGFMRMNLACTRATVQEALSRLHQAIEAWRAE